ncbi:hypothetical protein [Nostoc sp. DedQUE07]|uniref:hypothetical protein n=1 Tax=Nostoc sp. DedQUE07 TaxID=3075392 RepID=UPI002AD245DF|nr:hypothetical protein [Nostoc sp. DedQUE07]MDZ8131904.1 hypothetical protein [Nostoc sp. DedQUE07]
MRRINRSLNERKLQKGGGGKGGSASTAKSSTAAKSSGKRQKLNRTSTNTADKSTWQKPPTEAVTFFKGQRVQGGVKQDGTVYWTVDGSTSYQGGKPPMQEMRDLKRAWNEYKKSPNAKRKLTAYVADEDGRGAARLRMYQDFGFKISNQMGNSAKVTLNNFGRKPRQK